ncbi:hypothetical protein DE146DRAFT_364035 [Phaeosphaeria sp. MPI-PUGE-AT-0046c]|nr:hypothetical protein DE146DRAFT_364035 [Phaeosphaeria sp. MPI-PUGE-AT-0046c]
MFGRIVRHAAMMRIFYEPKTAMVAHTKASSLRANPDTRDWICAGTEDLGPAAGKFAEALEKWPGSQEPIETGFTLVNNTTGSTSDVVAQKSERPVRYASAMKVMTSKPESNISHAISHWDWRGGILVFASGYEIGSSSPGCYCR